MTKTTFFVTKEPKMVNFKLGHSSMRERKLSDFHDLSHICRILKPLSNWKTDGESI